MSRQQLYWQSYYQNNKRNAKVLEKIDWEFYAKYTDTLAVFGNNSKVLDVGCGVGQAVGRLKTSGIDAYGVDISVPNIEQARQLSKRCQVYDGITLPFSDNYFDASGALNVLEHVEEPEAFIRELVRVVRPGGRVVLSSPNFLRVIGFRDYHPHMRGLRQKWKNWKHLQKKCRQIQVDPTAVLFDRMEPIVRNSFQADDDAIIVTNPIEMKFFLEQAGCKVEKIFCTDRYVPRIIDFFLNLLPVRFVMFNAFLVARVL